jgi:Tfp pilus assembly protein PilN
MKSSPLNNPTPAEMSTNQPGFPAGNPQPSKKRIRTIIVLAIAGAAIVFFIVFFTSRQATAPNKALIDYLEQQRQEQLQQRQEIKEFIHQSMEVTAQYQYRDSLDRLEQLRLTQSLDNFRLLYESNNYVFSLDATGLRREYANFKP